MSATLAEIAAEIDAELQGDPASEIINVASLHNSTPGALSFFVNKHYYADLETTLPARLSMLPVSIIRRRAPCLSLSTNIIMLTWKRPAPAR
jgi:UDP-3-O-[3-hydroxymyristoyl] glucosamine N-acyltransferase